MPKIERWKLIGVPSWPMGGKDLAATLGVKHRALLAYLLMATEPIERDRLAAILWPESEPAKALHSLRQVLVDIRNALGEGESERLLSTGRLIAFGQDGIQTDLAEFEKLEHSGGAADSVLNILQGPLLEGLHARSDAFEAQLTSWRDSFASRALDLIDNTIVATSPSDSEEVVDALEEG